MRSSASSHDTFSFSFADRRCPIPLIGHYGNIWQLVLVLTTVAREKIMMIKVEMYFCIPILTTLLWQTQPLQLQMVCNTHIAMLWILIANDNGYLCKNKVFLQRLVSPVALAYLLLTKTQCSEYECNGLIGPTSF